MLAARVEQKNGTYVHNIQTGIQLRRTPPASPCSVSFRIAVHKSSSTAQNRIPGLPWSLRTITPSGAKALAVADEAPGAEGRRWRGSSERRYRRGLRQFS